MLQGNYWRNVSPWLKKKLFKKKLLCNTGPAHTDRFLQENNLRNIALTCLGQHCTKQYPLNADDVRSQSTA